MILWTPVDLDQVFEGWDEQAAYPVEMEYDGLLLMVEPLGNGKAKVLRLISSNPMDYLRTDIAPGLVLTMS